MGSLSDSNATDSFDNTLTGIMGGTDNSRIGNVGDRLKIDAQITSSIINSMPKQVQFIDAILARNTDITVAAGWVNIYSYTGSGYLYGALANLEGAGGAEATKWYFNIVIDTNFKLFGNYGILIGDMDDNNIYDIFDAAETFNQSFCGLYQTDNVIRYESCLMPIKFDSKIEIQIKRISTTKKFRAGLVKIYKVS